MNRALTVSLSIAFVTTVLAGCLGDDGDLSGAIPVARVTVTEIGGKIDTYLFDGSASTGRGLKYEWDFGDGSTGNEAKVEHTYEFGSGVYTATLTITDAAGIPDKWEADITVGDGVNLAPKAFFKPSARYLAVGEPLTVDARTTTDPEGDPILYEWDFNFIMTEAEYLNFRDAKQDADYENTVVAGGTSVQEGDGGTGETSSSLPTVDPDALTDLLDGDKDPGHGGGETHAVSLFNGFRSSEEPVFTLEEGFPDPTRFYVKLTTIDIKGETKEILSEEVWPVLVVETKAPEYHEGETSGTFTLGGPATLTDATPNTADTQPYYRDEWGYPFTIDNSIIEMYINVTWSQNPAADAASELANSIDIDVISPNGKERSASGGGEAISMQFTAADELGSGEWYVDLYARQGANIEWTSTYWAKVDLNPFRDLEAPYVEIERPDQDV